MDELTSKIKPVINRTHIALYVKDPFKSEAWYADVLGMEAVARGEQWVFMSFGKKHHDIALIRAPEPTDGGEASRGQINLQHYGLEVAGNFDDYRRLYGMLLEKKVPVVKTTDHKVGFGLYFEDPDGHRFEFFFETVHDDDEGKRILGAFDAPSDPIVLKPLK